MKLTESLILPALCWSVRLAAAATAHVYTYDPQSQPRSQPLATTMGPTTARLVLAQRIGVEDYHRSDLLREEILDAINDYGRRTSLFADEKSRTRSAFILVESDEISTDSIPSLKDHASFDVSPAPGDSSIRGLFVDLVRQADPESFSRIGDIGLYDWLSEDQLTAANGDMFQVVKSVAGFIALFNHLEKTDAWSITAFVMPHAHTGTFKDGGFMRHLQHDESHWGTYEMPGSQSPLKKRQMKEEPLTTETQGFNPVQSFSAPISAAAANNTTPFRGILPACFTSQAACESETRNCTGHGSCVRKYSDSTAQKDTSINCFVCACKATTSSDGKKTTTWGGPACQKKDISVQFWLIVLFTVGLIFLIGFAVGTIWEMGSAELPSVLGANVSGPSARK